MIRPYVLACAFAALPLCAARGAPAPASRSPPQPVPMPAQTGAPGHKAAAEPEPEPTLQGMMRALGAAFKRQLGEFQAVRLYCELLAARARFGRAAVFGVGAVEEINILIHHGQQRAGRDAAAFTKELGDHLPQIVIATDGNLWHWQGSRYALAFPALAWDVDEERGTLYAVNLERQMLWFDRQLGRFRPNGVTGVRDMQASEGLVYFINTDGLVQVRLKGQTKTILQRPVAPGASLHASRGVLYLIDGGALYRYANNSWEREGNPIQRNVRQVVADGKDYYALDLAGHVYSGTESRYLDSEGIYTNIWLLGQNLLALARSGRVSGYTASKRSWQVFRE